MHTYIDPELTPSWTQFRNTHKLLDVALSEILTSNLGISRTLRANLYGVMQFKMKTVYRVLK